MTPAWQRAAIFVVLLAALLLSWQALYLYAGDNALRSPPQTIQAAAALFSKHLFWINLAETARAFAMALALAVVLGVSLGIWLGHHRFSGELLTPILVGFASVPKVVLYPLVLLVFGLGISARVAFGMMFAVPPIAMSTISAVNNIRPVLLKVGRVLGLGSLDMARIVLIPAVLPEIMTGLRLGFSLCLIGTILGEMFAARLGLGYLLMTAIGLHDVDLIMSLTLTLTVFAVCASAALLALDRRMRRRL